MMKGKKRREKKETLKEGRAHHVEIGSQPPRVAIPRKITQQNPPTAPLYKPPLPSQLKTERQECQFFPTNETATGCEEGNFTGDYNPQFTKRKWVCFCGKVVWVREHE